MFNGLTNIGKEYIAKCLAENKPITFTKVKIGDGLLDLDENAELLTDVKSLKKEVEILDKTQEGELTTLTILLDNSDIEVGYYPREIGIYVTDDGIEKLYWYINDGLETQWLCAANKYPIKFKQIINLMTTNLESVIVNWSGKDLFVDREFVEEKIKEKVRTFEIPTIAELQSRKNLKVGDIVEVLGYYTAGDGAGHKRIIANEDDGSGIQLKNGLWANIVHNGEVNVSWFGAKGDGVTDDTQAIQKAINIADTLKFDKKTYVVSKCINPESCLVVEKNLIIYGNNAEIKQNHSIGTGKKHLLLLKPNKQNIINLFDITLNGGVENAELLEWDINHKGICVPDTAGGKPEKRIKYLYFNNVTITNTNGESAFSADGVQECLFENCLFMHSAANMGNISGATKYLNCKFRYGNYLGIEHVSRAFDGYLIVENCEFDKTIKRGSTAISAIHQYGDFNVSDPNEFQKKLESRRNTRLEVRNCKFFNDIDYMNNTTNSRSLSSIGVYFYGYETTEISNNVFINYGSLSTYGSSAIRVQNFNENVTIKNNNFIFYNEFLELGNCACFGFEFKVQKEKSGTSRFIFTDNKILHDFENNKVDTKKLPAMFVNNSKKELIEYSFFKNNVYQVFKTNLTATNTSILGHGIDLPITTAFNIKLKLNIKVEGKKHIYLANDSHSNIKDIVNENLTVGEHEFNYSFYQENQTNLLQRINLRCAVGDISDEIEIIFTEIDNIDKVSISPINELNTLYYAEKLKQENVYDDYITYMDEKTSYDKQQKQLNKDKQLAYQETLKENPNLTYEEFMSLQPMTLNLIEEPQPSARLQEFMDKYL